MTEYLLNLPYSDFDGGIFNPSIICFDGRLIGVARAEKYRQREKNTEPSKYFEEIQAPIFSIDEDFKISSLEWMVFENFPARFRTEDYRLFCANGVLYCSHTYFTPSMKLTAQGLSRVHPERNSIEFLGMIDVPFSMPQGHEKNWGFFSRLEEMYCIYGVFPRSILFRLTEFPAPVCEIAQSRNTTRLKKILRPDQFVSVSSAPVLIQSHFYMIIHQHDPRFFYRHFLLRLNPVNMMPVAVAEAPILEKTTTEGYGPGGVVTIMSMVELPWSSEIAISFGEGDYYSKLLILSSEAFHSQHWVNLT